jgi:hypothetical protein
MSSIDTVKCPNCGTTKTYHLGGYGFAFQQNTTCGNCGTVFDNIAHSVASVDPDPITRVLFDRDRRAEPSEKTYTEDQILSAITDMMKRRSFAVFYNGVFGEYLAGDRTEEVMRTYLKSLLRVPLQVVAK